MTDQPFGSALRFWILSLVWLPAGIAAVSLLRGVPLPDQPRDAVHASRGALRARVYGSVRAAARLGLPANLAGGVTARGPDIVRDTRAAYGGGGFVRGPARPDRDRGLRRRAQRAGVDRLRDRAAPHFILTDAAVLV